MVALEEIRCKSELSFAGYKKKKKKKKIAGNYSLKDVN